MTPHPPVAFRPWAVVLGAALRPEGAPARQLEDRLLAGIRLLRDARTERLLLTGSAVTPWGNEVRAMHAFCRDRDVPAAQLVCDAGGTRTRHSLLRAASLFGVRSAWVCTQRYHLPRALFWARVAHIDAQGIPADLHRYRRSTLHLLREGAAWALALAERALLPREPL